MKLLAFVAVVAICDAGEIKTLTLREALARAMAENPDVLIARLDQQKARDQILIAKDPFYPKVYGGSGLAWSPGYPTTIDGNPPSIFEARTDMSLFDRSQSYKIGQAKEGLRGAAIDVTKRQEEAVVAGFQGRGVHPGDSSTAPTITSFMTLLAIKSRLHSLNCPILDVTAAGTHLTLIPLSVTVALSSMHTEP